MTLIAVSGLGLLVVDAHRRLWGAVFVIGLAAEQLIAGLRILKIDFGMRHMWCTESRRHWRMRRILALFQLVLALPFSRCCGWDCW